jgi:predicted phosphate transport protein (TIGR00153 family)
MFGRFMPREGRFFDFFNAHVEQVALAAQQLVKLMSASTDEMPAIVSTIDEIETRADKITHDTVALLHTTFITPFDRDAIHALINDLDDIVDSIQDVAEGISLYNIRRLTPDAVQMADLTLSCVERVRQIVGLISSMDHASDILRTCREIEQLESDVDRVMRSALSRVFRDEREPLQVIKMKAIYEGLEKISDHCEDVSKVIEGIVLENA